MPSYDLLNRITTPTLPDSAQLGGRLFLTDGVNANLVMVGGQSDLRPMGCQAVAEMAVQLAFATGLTGNAAYTWGVRRVLSQGALEIPSGMRTLSRTTKHLVFECAPTAADEPGDWSSVADGEFAITIAGTAYDVTAIDFSATHGNGAVDEMTDVAARIQTALRGETGSDEIVTWDPVDAVFQIKTTTGATSAIAAVSGGGGTDIAASGYMNGVGGAAVDEYRYDCGATAADAPGDWSAVDDGAFAIVIAGTPYAVSGVDFSATHADGAATDMDEVALRLQTALRAATSGGEHVTWESGNARFLVRSTAGAVGAPTAPASGTDVSVKGYMNAPGGLAVTGTCAAKVLVEEYEYDLPSWCSVSYEVWRSKAADPTTLYRLAVLTEAERAALTDDLYDDTAADAAVSEDSAGTYSTETGDLLATVPPVRYVRAWDGALVMGGSYAYEEGDVTGTAGAETVALNSPGECSPADVGAFLAIDGEPQTFLVADVDTVAGTYALDKPLTLDHDGSGYVRFRDFDKVYVTQQLPENIELYDAASGVVYGNAGDNDPIAGIAVNSGWCYILRRHRVEMLTGSPSAAAVVPHPDAPPGCRSHATIADLYCPALLYYAGQAGIVMVRGSSAKLVGQRVQGILDTRVDHSMDGFAHGVYDPRRRMYYLWLFETDWETRVGARVPDLLLSYSLDRDDWCVSRLAASRSGLWRRRDGELVPVIGIGGGVAYLDMGFSDGEEAAGTATAADTASLTDAAASFPATGAGLAGSPIVVYHADGTTQERVIKRNTATAVWPYAAFDPAPAVGDAYRIGSIPWSVSFEDLGLGGGESTDIPFERSVRVDRVAVLHTNDQTGQQISAMLRRRAGDDTRLEAGTKEMEKDWNDETVTVWSGKDAGLRAHGVRLELSGQSAPVGIRAVAVVMEEISK